MNLNLLTWILVISPLIGGSLAGFFSRWLTRSGVQTVTTLSVAISFLVSLSLSWQCWVMGHSAWHVKGFTWYLGEYNYFSIGLQVDSLTLVMTTMVTFISLLVHIYSIAYMKEDMGYRRFFSYISFFTFAMLILVTADNFLQLFFGWEAVGLMSYLLISFWFQKPEAIQGSFKAFLVNRVGDFGFLLGIALIFKEVGSIHYDAVLHAIPHLREATFDLFGSQYPVLDVIGVLLFIGAMGKSAQIPLHVWLPESMAGPTPISALIHAATMVTAGIYMVSRLSFLFNYAPCARSLILIIGTTTALLTGLVAITQSDIKRVIAFSTLSQLGFMVAALGVSAYSFSVFHLLTHAFFKALLFLSAGSVIFSLHHEQDIHKMGGLWRRLPITYVCFLIGAFALIALPPFSGFYSKEPIIEAVYHASFNTTHPWLSYYAFYSLLGSAFLTALYTGRLLFLVFHGKSRLDDGKLDLLRKEYCTQNRGIAPDEKRSVLEVREHRSPSLTTSLGARRTFEREAPYWMLIPLILLAIPAACLGKLLVAAIEDGRCLGASVWMTSHLHGMPHANGLPALGSLPTVLSVAGLLITWFCYVKKPNLPNMIAKRMGSFYEFLRNHYQLDNFNQRFWVNGTWNLSSQFARWESAFLDQKIVHGAARLTHQVGSWLHRIHTGYLYHSIFLMILGVFALLAFIIIRI